MHILLINVNPVVSRLFILCTRDDSVILDEVSTIEDIQNKIYDIVFVDEDSYENTITNVLSKMKVSKKVFISYQEDKIKDFDTTIRKPFLPSQITDIIKDVKYTKVEEIIDDEKVPSIFPLTTEDNSEELININEHESQNNMLASVLDNDEIEKIKILLDMDEELEVLDEVLSEDEIEAKKVALIKEQLISEGLEIVEEDKIVEELSINLNGTLKKKKKSKEVKFTEENMERIEDAVEMAMATMSKKKMRKLLKGKKIKVRVKLEEKA